MMRLLLVIVTFFLLQSVYSQFDDYENKRRVKYFEEGNDIYSVRGGKALDERGYEFSIRLDSFIKDGVSWGTSLNAIVQHPQKYYVGETQNLRAYLFYYKIRPFIEVNHTFKFGYDVSFNAGVGSGVSIAGITDMLGIDFMILYEVPYLSFDGYEREEYIITSIGINFQW